jgi:hypothetical protein
LTCGPTSAWSSSLPSAVCTEDPPKALRGGISKVNSRQVCQLLATVPRKMAPKPSPNLRTVPWDTPTKDLLWLSRLAAGLVSEVSQAVLGRSRGRGLCHKFSRGRGLCHKFAGIDFCKTTLHPSQSLVVREGGGYATQRARKGFSVRLSLLVCHPYP